jgi:CTP synthase (UTP-ammonia lyase)
VNANFKDEKMIESAARLERIENSLLAETTLESDRPMATTRIAIIGDYNPETRTHPATGDSLRHAANSLGLVVDSEWLSTAWPATISRLPEFDAIWIAPGGPYKSRDTALEAIRYARDRDVPLIGTCGGFQHIVIEYARNVLGLADAEHAEYDPNACNLFVTPLSCSLVGKRCAIRLPPGSRTSGFYEGCTVIEEEYRCSFGLNPQHQAALEKSGLRVVGAGDQGEARVMEMPDHRFFVGTLFVPQLLSTDSHPHPLIVAFVREAARNCAG